MLRTAALRQQLAAKGERDGRGGREGVPGIRRNQNTQIQFRIE